MHAVHDHVIQTNQSCLNMCIYVQSNWYLCLQLVVVIVANRQRSGHESSSFRCDDKSERR